VTTFRTTLRHPTRTVWRRWRRVTRRQPLLWFVPIMVAPTLLLLAARSAPTTAAGWALVAAFAAALWAVRRHGARAPRLVRRLAAKHAAPLTFAAIGLALLAGVFIIGAVPGPVIVAALVLAAVALTARALFVSSRGHGGQDPRRALGRKAYALLGWGRPESDAQAVNVVKLPADPSAVGAVIRLRCHPDFTGGAAVDKLATLIGGLYGGQWCPRTDLAHDQILFRRAEEVRPPSLPLSCAYTDSDPDGPPTTVPIGVHDDGSALTVDLTGSPHMMLNSPTGGGKTSLEVLITAHWAGHGGLITIIDPKHSDDFSDAFDGLPNVRRLVDGGDIAATLNTLAGDMKMRERLSRAERARLPRLLIVIDEVNALTSSLQRAWQAAKGKGRPPALMSLEDILTRGRSSGVHVIVAGQQLSAASLGGSLARDQFDLRLAAGRLSTGAQSMVFGDDAVPELERVINGKTVKGRALIQVGGGEVRPVQLAFVPNSAARSLAARGTATWALYRSPAAPASAPATPAPEPAPQSPAEAPEPPAGNAQTGTDRGRPDDPMPTSGSRTRAHSGAMPTATPTSMPTAMPTARADREPVILVCNNPDCGMEFQTRIKAGSAARCSHCGKSRKVPVGARTGTA